MSGHWPCGKRAVVAGMFAVCLCGTAVAQKLDLDSAGSFKAGSEKSVDRLDKELRSSVKEAAARAQRADAGAALLLRAQNRVREYAAALLEAGSAMADAGSLHVLIGRRIAARRKELDQAFADLQANAGDVGKRAIEAFLRDCPSDVKPIPRSAQELDALTARVFGPLARLSGAKSTSAWPIVRLDPARGTDQALRAVIDECALVKGVTPEAITTLRQAATSLAARAASGEPAEPIAAQRQLIGQGAQLVLRLPKWVAPKTAALLMTAFDGLARRAAVPEMREGASADLCRMALLSDVLERIDKLKLTSKQSRSLRAVGVALADSVAGGGTESDDALAALRRGLLMVEAYDDAKWNENHRVVREVRPLWREVELEGRRSREELVEVLARLTPKMPALSDPGVLGGISAVGQTVEDGKRLCIISAWLAGDNRAGETGRAIWDGNLPKAPDGKVREPATQREDRVRRQAGVKLLALGQKAHETDTRAEAMGEMEALANGLSAWMPIAGEDDLRAAVSSPDSPVGVRWRELTGGAAADIAHAVEEARGEYLTGWAGVKERATPGAAAPEGAPDAGRIDALRRLVELAADCAVALGMADPAGKCSAKAWPGFELSAEAYASALSPLKAELSRAGGMVISGTPEGVAESVKSLEKTAAISGMLARLERAARVHVRGSVSMLDELANPPPALPTLGEDLTPGVWLLPEQGSIALVCRCLEEYAEATKEADKARATPLLNRAIAEAERVTPSIK